MFSLLRTDVLTLSATHATLVLAVCETESERVEHVEVTVQYAGASELERMDRWTAEHWLSVDSIAACPFVGPFARAEFRGFVLSVRDRMRAAVDAALERQRKAQIP